MNVEVYTFYISIVNDARHINCGLLDFCKLPTDCQRTDMFLALTGKCKSNYIFYIHAIYISVYHGFLHYITSYFSPHCSISILSPLYMWSLLQQSHRIHPCQNFIYLKQRKDIINSSQLSLIKSSMQTNY